MGDIITGGPRSFEHLACVPLHLVISYVAEDKRALKALLLSAKWVREAVKACPEAWKRVTVSLTPGVPLVQVDMVPDDVMSYIRLLRIDITGQMTRAELIERLGRRFVCGSPGVHTLTISHGPFPPEKLPLAWLKMRFPNIQHLIWEGQLQAGNFKVIGANWPDLESFDLTVRRRGRGIRRVLRAVDIFTHFRSLKVLRAPQFDADGAQLKALFDLEGVQDRLEELSIGAGKGAGPVLMEALGGLTALKHLCINSDLPDHKQGLCERAFWRQNHILGVVSHLPNLQHLMLEFYISVSKESLGGFLASSVARLKTLYLGSLETVDAQILTQLTDSQPDLRILSLAAQSWENVGPAGMAIFARGLPRLEYLLLKNFEHRMRPTDVLIDGVLAHSGDLKMIRSLKCVFILHDSTEDRATVQVVKAALGPEILFYSAAVDPRAAIWKISSCAFLLRHLSEFELEHYDFREGY